MNRAIILCALILQSCAGGSESTTKSNQTDHPRPVKSVVASSSKYVERDFAGLSTPLMAVNLAFKLSGQVLKTYVGTGEAVAKDQLLCQLDPRDMELQLISDRSTYEEAKSSYDRAQRLLSHDAVSMQEVERARSSYMTAKSHYENTSEILEQTALKAPFEAVVERIYIDDYQRVQAGEAIMRIVTPFTTKVEFTLPESSLMAIQDSLTRFRVRFDNLPDISFDAKIREYARTSSDASGFPVSLTINNPDPERYRISSGMSCTITMITPQSDREAVVLPLSTIFSPTSGGTYVWIIGADDRVERHQVVLAEPTGQGSVVVENGVMSGDRVVSAGVYQLRDGQSVKIISE